MLQALTVKMHQYSIRIIRISAWISGQKEQYPELEPFDIVINNAGVQNEEDIDVNLKGT